MSYNMTGAGYGGNINFSKGGLAAGTTTTHSTTATITYSIGGQLYTKTAITNGASPTTDFNTSAAFLPLAADRACNFVFALDSSGNVRVVQGPIVTLSQVTGGLAAVPFPTLPDSLCPFGYLYAQAGTTLASAWTFGTSNLSSVTGMTYTFRDIARVPAQPITA